MFHSLTRNNFNDLLNRFSTTELEAMLSTYPYLHQAHLLLAKKYQVENNPAFDEQLQLAALYAQDRELFFFLFHEQEVVKAVPTIVNTAVHEERGKVAEKPLTQQEFATVQKEMETPPLAESEKPVEPLPEEIAQTPTAQAQEIETDSQDMEGAGKEEETVFLKENSTAKGIEIEEKERGIVPAAETENPEEFHVAEVAPLQEEANDESLWKEDHTFADWLKVFSKEPVEVTREALKATPNPPETNQDLDHLIRSNISVNYLHELVTEETRYSRGLDDFIQEQINKRKTSDRKIIKSENEIDPEMATETLAKLYEAQKRYSKAIATYEMLALKFPEKNDFFAARINDLKKMI